MGLSALQPPLVKSIGDGLWELRFSARDGTARSFYLTASERRIVILHSFVKKSQKTPKAALDLARQRAKLMN